MHSVRGIGRWTSTHGDRWSATEVQARVHCLESFIALFLSDSLNALKGLSSVVVEDRGTILDMECVRQPDSRVSLATRATIASLANHLADGVLTVNKAGQIIFANESATAITGYAKSEILGQAIEELFPYDVERHAESHPIGKALKTKETVSFQSKPRSKQIELIVIPTPDPIEVSDLDGHIIIVLRNPTATSDSNEEDHTARMRLMGQLTMGIAHDFNNALTSIICNTQLVHEIVDRLSDDRGQESEIVAQEWARAPRYLDDITRVSRKAAGFIRTLLAYPRQQQLAREPIDLNEAVSDIMYLTRKLFGERVTANFHAEQNLSLIYAERSQIDQVLWNLLVNARDAMPHGGHLLVQTAFITLDNSFTATRAWARPGDFVRLSVSDTGTGMDQQTLKKIFDPFFTTKGEGQGSGLGLPTVFGIVKQHNGYIDVQSELGKGTRFDIYLPLAEAHHRRLPSNTGASAWAKSGVMARRSLILVAEDNDNLRMLFKRIITRSGSRVVTANAGDKALKLFRKLRRQGNQVDLVILDVGLPGMDGRMVCQKIHAIDPEVPVLLTSGYGIPFNQDRSITEEGYEFLPKPFDGDQLLTRIEEMLGKSPRPNLRTFESESVFVPDTVS
jgi:two-component system, cell cycle sensor histidine kinase and response regulator CckA